MKYLIIALIPVLIVQCADKIMINKDPEVNCSGQLMWKDGMCLCFDGSKVYGDPERLRTVFLKEENCYKE